VMVLTSEKELSIICVNTVRQKKVLMCDECACSYMVQNKHI
jgi:hypothetical protein